MNGQGTVAYELMNQVSDLDAILVSVSGGGLISGNLSCLILLFQFIFQFIVY